MLAVDKIITFEKTNLKAPGQHIYGMQRYLKTNNRISPTTKNWMTDVPLTPLLQSEKTHH